MTNLILIESQLHALMPRADTKRWTGPLGAAMSHFGLSAPRRAAMFLAQVAHESAELTRVVENLNYSAERLRQVWPSRFRPELVAAYARRPEAIANRVYADRMGNGPQSSCDGWRFRGRGPIQITGRDAYRRAGEALLLPLEFQPDMVADDPNVGALVAAWVFAEWKGCIRWADAGDLGACTLAINGGMNGINERGRYYRAARRIYGLQ